MNAGAEAKAGLGCKAGAIKTASYLLPSGLSCPTKLHKPTMNNDNGVRQRDRARRFAIARAGVAPRSVVRRYR